MATKQDEFALSGPQDIALRALLTGATVTDAANQANVVRQTVSTWIHHDAAFAAALNAGRQSAHAAVQDRLRALGTKALDVIARHLDEDDDAALSAAVEIVKLLLKVPIPVGETDPAMIQELMDMRAVFRY